MEGSFALQIKENYFIIISGMKASFIDAVKTLIRIH
jgi:hypothetical protein